MRKRLRILILSVFLTVAGAFVWLALRPHEPVYKGQRLTYWLQATPKEKEEALRQIGTNAIPVLLRMLREKDSETTVKVFDFIGVEHSPASSRNYLASSAFENLGADAKDAVPSLISIVETDGSYMSQGCAAIALGHIGPDASKAIPALIRATTNRYANVRWSSVWALGEIKADASKVVPVLVNRLHDGSVWVRANAASSLGEFGADALSAIPALTDSITNVQPGDNWGIADENGHLPGYYVRSNALEAIKKIDPTNAQNWIESHAEEARYYQ